MALNRDRVAAIGEAAGIDAMVATTAPNVRYCLGVLPASLTRQPDGAAVWVVVPTDPELPIGVIAPEHDLPELVALPAGTVRAFGQDAFLPLGPHDIPAAGGVGALVRQTRGLRTPSAPAALAAVLGRLGLLSGRIAVDDLSPAMAIRETWLPQATLFDGRGVFRATRAVKSAAEIAALRAAAHANQTALLDAVALIEPGRRWSDVVEAWRRSLADQGAETTVWHGTVVPNRQWSVASSRALVRHDVVALRGAGAVDGYWSDLSRIAHVGDPLVRPARLTKALADILNGLLAAIRPGLPIAELARLHHEALAAVGLPTQAAAESRGVGLELGELPVVHPTASGVLEAGHVIAIAAPARDLNWGDVEIAEVVVVTPRGAEPLSTLPWDIIATRG